MIEQLNFLVSKGEDHISKYGNDNFHQFATDELLKSDFHNVFNFNDVFQHFFSDQLDALQNYRNLEFSDLPLTLARSENCFIEIYCWRRRPTTIHNHHFSGAFMCMEGHNVDIEYDFQKHSSIGHLIELGKLSVKKEKTMKAGDVATIAPLDKYIHQNHHQSDLTINLTFRTNNLKNKNLSNYLFSGIKYEKDISTLNRLHILRRGIDFSVIKTENLSLSDEEAIYFLTQHYEEGSGNKHLSFFADKLESQIKKKFQISVMKLLRDHDKKLSEMEDSYL